MLPNPNDPMFDSAPRIVIWEMTRACALACNHCRAEAIPRRDSNELNTSEAFKFVEEVEKCGKPLLVLTGGDPLMRDDIYKIVEYATSLGIPVSVAPSATGRLTSQAIRRLAMAGVARIALSLDAPDAASHDAFRGVKGAYVRTLGAAVEALECGMSLQINTTVSQMNRTRLCEFEDVLTPLGIAMWSLFFVLPVGRAGSEMCLSASETEAAFRDIFAVSSRAKFQVKTTEAPHYRRFVMQQGTATLNSFGIGDGRGFIFVSRDGDVMPSGFLPLVLGNVRKHSLIDLYRDNAIARRLRKPDSFQGKCGVCEFNKICGGSRARAYAVTGDAFASDPSCEYVPAALAKA